MSTPILFAKKSENVTIAAGASGVVLLPRPHDGPSTQVVSPISGLDFPIDLPVSAAPVKKLTFPDVTPADTRDTGGRVSVSLSATFAIAGIDVEKLEVINGPLGDYAPWDDDGSGAIKGNDAVLLPEIVQRIPLVGVQQVRLTLKNTTGAPIVGFALGRFEMNVAEDRLLVQ